MSSRRVALAVLSVMSIFTGLVAPAFSIGSLQIPLPMTNAREITVLILFLLSLLFYLAIEQKQRWYDLFAVIVTILLVWVFGSYLQGQVVEIRSGAQIRDLSWGWIFLVFGVIGFIWQSHTGRAISQRTSFSEHLFAILGSLTILGLSAIILFASLYSSTRAPQKSVLSGFFGNGVMQGSGVLLSPGQINTPKSLSYDRGENLLTFLTPTQTGTILSHSRGVFPNTPFPSLSILQKQSDRIVGLTSDGSIFRLIDGASITLLDRALTRHGTTITSLSGAWTVWGSEDTITLFHTGAIDDFILNTDQDHLLWTQTQSGSTVVSNNNFSFYTTPGRVEKLSISKNGYDSILLVSLTDGYRVVKNGQEIRTIHQIGLTESWQSNGLISAFIESRENKKYLNVEGGLVSKPLDEIREIFLEENGYSYAYFARETGSEKWCFFSKRNGSLCDLDGYMNPVLAADGKSIIFAGYREGKWRIYRNTDVVVEETGYTSTQITRDYFFVDRTNPKKYLFSVYLRESNKYQMIKHGRLLPEVWDDIGVDVSFGFDDTVIMSVARDGVWHIAEL